MGYYTQAGYTVSAVTATQLVISAVSPVPHFRKVWTLGRTHIPLVRASLCWLQHILTLYCGDAIYAAPTCIANVVVMLKRHEKTASEPVGYNRASVWETDDLTDPSDSLNSFMNGVESWSHCNLWISAEALWRYDAFLVRQCPLLQCPAPSIAYHAFSVDLI